MRRTQLLFVTYFILFLALSIGGCSQEDELKKADTLYWKITKLCKQGRVADAIPIAQQLLLIKEKIFGAEHLEVAIVLRNLAGLYTFLGDYDKAEPLFQRALTIRKETLDPEDPLVAQSMNELVRFYATSGQHARAESLHQQAIAIKERTFGHKHPDAAYCMHDLAGIYLSLGNNDMVLALHQRALAMRKESYGYEHPLVAQSMNELGSFYLCHRDYSKAEPLFKKALSISEKCLGSEDPLVAQSLSNLANIYSSHGDYAKAKPLLERSLAIRDKTFGPEHPLSAESLNDLARLYHSMGDYARVEPMYKRALKIRKKALGPEHPDVANSLNDLAGLYIFLGEYVKAEKFYKKSLAIFEKSLGPENPFVAVSLNNLADFYKGMGDYTKSEPMYKRSLSILESINGVEHPNIVPPLDNLANLYMKLGEYAKAESLYLRALAILEKTFGPEYHEVSIPLNNLAGLYCRLGDYAKAEPLYERSLTINKKFFGSEHTSMTLGLNNLATMYAGMGNFEKAHDLYMQAERISEKLIDQVMGFTTERQKIGFLNNQNYNLYTFLSLINQHLVESTTARRDALNIWLKKKGLALKTQKRFWEALIKTDDLEQIKVFQALSHVRFLLSELAFTGPGKREPTEHSERIAELKQQKDELEDRLCRFSQAYAIELMRNKADSKKVAWSLPSGSVLVDFANVPTFNFQARDRQNLWYPSHYIAFMLHAGEPDNIKIIDLGEASIIDKTITAFKKSIDDPRDHKGLKTTQLSKKLYTLVFEPVRKQLGFTNKVFISPDGNLNLIPFEIFQGPDGRYLIEDYTFNYIAAGRDIIGFRKTLSKSGKSVIIGGPDYNLNLNEGRQVTTQNAVETSSIDSFTQFSDMRGFHFDPLPGSHEEVKAIQKLMGQDRALLYTGRQATEDVLMQCDSPKFLHLSTHGFFLGDQVSRTSLNGFSVNNFPSLPNKSKPVGIQNPLLRSGIALAGANRASATAGQSSGIVTAEKILTLKLWGTDMVVLSACNTGLGEIKSGEGVFGLRRAFTHVGAKSIVMSMWSVPDRETKELMVEFYKNFLDGDDRCQALRQAAIKQMKTVKKRYGNTNPYFWGAFVFMGES